MKENREQYAEFLNYWEEQFNVHDVYIRIFSGPKGYIAWAANRTMLETCIDKAGIEGEINYNDMPFAPVEWFEPGGGSTALEAAQGAVEAYQRASQDPEEQARMNAGCVAIAEMLRSA
jgi:hypothetical protein